MDEAYKFETEVMFLDCYNVAGNIHVYVARWLRPCRSVWTTMVRNFQDFCNRDINDAQINPNSASKVLLLCAIWEVMFLNGFVKTAIQRFIFLLKFEQRVMFKPAFLP